MTDKAMEIERQQDEILDEMSEVLDRLKNQSEHIGGELETQNKILTNLEEEVDEANDKTKSALKKIERELHRSSSKGGIIGFLSVTSLALLALIIAKPKL